MAESTRAAPSEYKAYRRRVFPVSYTHLDVYKRQGGKQSRTVNVRVLAATNRNLEEAIQQNAFREDLYYRLNVFTLNVPPLRERPSDIPLLIRHFLDHFALSLGRGPLGVTDQALEALTAYPWPGNIRELENIMERMAHMSQGSPVIDLDVLPAKIPVSYTHLASAGRGAPMPGRSPPLGGGCGPTATSPPPRAR